MKKLSELPYTTNLIWKSHSFFTGDGVLISKAEYLDDKHNYPNGHLFLTETEEMKISLLDIQMWLDTEEENHGYEGWAEQVYDDIKDSPEIQAFLNFMNRAMRKRPVYNAGAEIEIDM